MGRKIDILCRDGSPLGVTENSIFGKDGRLGIGGSELALLTMCAAWKFYGNDVTLYNNPDEHQGSSFRQRSISEFNPNEDRDILIIFRSPNQLASQSKGRKIWWSCDSYTIDDFRSFRPQVDKVVCISPHHAKYFNDMYGINDAVSIDIPVRTWEYTQDVEKVSQRCIYTSIPDRGVLNLVAAWPRINREVPDSSLVITSDWRLWNKFLGEEVLRHYKMSFARLPKVSYVGAVNRSSLIQYQLEADLHLYPCTFEEMFCISVAESQVAGVFPITSDYGALKTTNMGRVIHGNPEDVVWQDVFVRNAIESLTDPKLKDKQQYVREVAKKRFSIENILSKWEEVFE